MSAWVEEEWCDFCGVNPAVGLCSSCQADEDFANCRFCHGTSCTQECDTCERCNGHGTIVIGSADGGSASECPDCAGTGREER